MNWYSLKIEDTVDSPALLVYPDRIRANIDLLKTMIDDLSRLRPHIKTHKTKEILQLQLDAGIQKFKCATLAEATLLGECQAADVLLAYPLVDPKIDRFFGLIQRYPWTRYSTIVDNEIAAKALAQKCTKHSLELDVYIDLNIGMGRTGIQPDKSSVKLYRLCATLQGLSVRGFHAYDGHVRETDLAKRKVICAQNFKPIQQIADQLVSEGFPKPRIIIGGSPSFPVYAEYPEVECSPGTFVLWDKGYADSLPEQQFLPAGVLMTRVISIPSDRTVCIDLGYKAIASENPLNNRVYFLNAPELQPVSHSEEHMVLETDENHNLQIGDVLYALPIHICPTVALYDQLVVVENGIATDRWKVAARGR